MISVKAFAHLGKWLPLLGLRWVSLLGGPPGFCAGRERVVDGIRWSVSASRRCHSILPCPGSRAQPAHPSAAWSTCGTGRLHVMGSVVGLVSLLPHLREETKPLPYLVSEA